MDEKEYAGFWIRVAASLIDALVMAVFICLPLTLIYGVEYWTGEQSFYGFWDLMLSYVLPFVATIWFWRTYLGTPGKIMLKLKVVDAESGERLTIPQSIGRYLAYIPSALFLCLGFVWVGFTGKKQGWHDKLAGTVVVRG